MKYFALFVLFIVLAITFNVWLDHGCKLQGVMTWHGKVCIN